MVQKVPVVNDTRHAREPRPSPNFEAKTTQATPDPNTTQPSKPAPRKGKSCGSSGTRYKEHQVRRLLPAEILKVAIKEYSTRAKRAQALKAPNPEIDPDDELLDKVDLESLKQAVQDTVREMAEEEALRPLLKVGLLERLVMKATHELIRNEEFRERLERAYDRRLRLLEAAKKEAAAIKSGHKPKANAGKPTMKTSHSRATLTKKPVISSSHAKVRISRSPLTATPKNKTIH